MILVWQGRSDDQRELLDAESIAGHLLKGGQRFFCVPGWPPTRSCFPDEMFHGLVSRQVGAGPSVAGRCNGPAVITPAGLARPCRMAENRRCGHLRSAVESGLPGFRSPPVRSTPTTLTYWRRPNWRPRNDRTESLRTVQGPWVAETGALTGQDPPARWIPRCLDDAVATQDTVTQFDRRDPPGASRGRSRVAAEVILRATAAPHDYDDPGKPVIAWDDADGPGIGWSTGLVSDAHRAVGASARPGAGPAPPRPRRWRLLALVAGQGRRTGGGLRWHRRALAQSPGRWPPDRVDLHRRPPTTRHVHKTVQSPSGRNSRAPRGDRTRHRHHHRLRACAKPAAPITMRPSWGWSCSPTRNPGLEVLGDSAYGHRRGPRRNWPMPAHSAVIKTIPTAHPHRGRIHPR